MNNEQGNILRNKKIKEYGLEIVIDDEKYWQNLGYKIDYKKNLLIKEVKK